MKFIITVFQFMYEYVLILPSNAATYDNYTTVFSTVTWGFSKWGKHTPVCTFEATRRYLRIFM